MSGGVFIGIVLVLLAGAALLDCLVTRLDNRRLRRILARHRLGIDAGAPEGAPAQTPWGPLSDPPDRYRREAAL